MKTINTLIESIIAKSHQLLESASGSIIKTVTVRYSHPVWVMDGNYKPDAVRSDYRLTGSIWTVTAEGCGTPLVAGQCEPTRAVTLTVDAAPPVDDVTAFAWTSMSEAEKDKARNEHQIVVDYSADYETRREAASKRFQLVK